MKIEIEKPIVPQFIADWLETMYLRKGDKYPVLGLVFGRGSVIDEPVYNWVVDNKDTFVLAILYGYEVEQEPLYYAKIKGWEDEYFYGFGEKFRTPKVTRPCAFRLTKEVWNDELGINDINADFEKVEE